MRHPLGVTSSSSTPIILLIGYPGTGKYTVGKALVEQLQSAGATSVLVDNHFINNPIFRLIEVDGRSPLPAEVWDRVGEFRETLLKTIESLAPRDRAFVFTNWIAEDESGAAEYLARLEAIAQARQSRFAVVRLVCELQTLKERVPRADRAERLKWTDPDAVAALASRHRLYDPTVPSLTIDNTELSADACARQILSYAAAG